MENWPSELKAFGMVCITLMLLALIIASCLRGQTESRNKLFMNCFEATKSVPECVILENYDGIKTVGE